MKPSTMAPESRAQQIVHQELKILARVTHVLSEFSSANVGSPDFDRALIDLRDQVGEAKPEDIPALVEQMMRISAVSQRYGKGRDLPVDPESPYFAHLTLEEGDRQRDVLIGKRGFIDRGRKVTIVDWRNAPVSRIYYRYAEGDDYEEEFGGKVMEGWIRARRSVTIDHAQLLRIACPQGTFACGEDGNWEEAEVRPPARLGGGQGKAARPEMYRKGGEKSRLGIHGGPRIRADKHLPEIAALIDPTQFQLITKPESGLVVLQGGAGSGKTTVALHRVAYLNFQLPGRFAAHRIMVVVFTKAMVRYVSRILPGLGVKGVPVLTAANWLNRRRRKVAPGTPKRYSQETPGVVTRFKKHPLILELGQLYVARQVAELEARLEQELEGIPERGQVLQRWRDHGAGKAPVTRAQALVSWAEEQLSAGAISMQRILVATRAMARRLDDIVSDWSEMLTDGPLMTETVARHCPGDFTEQDLRRVTRWVSDQLGPDGWGGASHHGSGGGGGGNNHPGGMPRTEDPYIGVDGQDERVDTRAEYMDGPDDALLLYMSLLKRGAVQPPGKKPVRYEHLVVDEAQDLSAVELKVMLACTGQLRSVTLTGDTAQRTVFDNGFSDWESTLARVGEREATTSTLRLSYRSTEPIMELARSLAGEEVAGGGMVHTRGGEPVELLGYTEQGELIAALAEALRSLTPREPRASVALLTRHLEQARIYAAALTDAEVPGVKLVANQEFSFRPGVEVTDVTQPKGLEFDYVILLDVSAVNYPDTLESRHLLHIAATRAAHQLWITAVGKPSPLLPPF